MEKQSGLFIRNGNPVMLGANKNAEGLNFAAEIPCGADASLVLYIKVPYTREKKSLIRKRVEREKCVLFLCQDWIQKNMNIIFE